MSCMLRKNDCVPAGTLAQLIAGDKPSPVATPGAAWLNFTGTSPPSGNPATVNVIAGAAGAAPRCWAAIGIAMNTAIVETTNHILVFMLFSSGLSERAMVTYAGNGARPSSRSPGDVIRHRGRGRGDDTRRRGCPRCERGRHHQAEPSGRGRRGRRGA